MVSTDHLKNIQNNIWGQNTSLNFEVIECPIVFLTGRVKIESFERSTVSKLTFCLSCVFESNELTNLVVFLSLVWCSNKRHRKKHLKMLKFCKWKCRPVLVCVLFYLARDKKFYLYITPKLKFLPILTQNPHFKNSSKILYVYPHSQHAVLIMTLKNCLLWL